MSTAAAPPPEAAWVLQAPEPRRRQRAVRALTRHADVARTVPLSRSTVCVQLAAPEVPAKLARKVQRKLGAEVELRLDCDVAWAPMGRGFVLLVVEQPADALETVLAAARPAFHDIAWPSDPAAPVRVCVPRPSMADPLSLAEALRAQGIRVSAVYEVGGCRR
ncbi:MAG: hypothetical protein R3F59_01795 [Myxococcota bacterium]